MLIQQKYASGTQFLEEMNEPAEKQELKGKIAYSCKSEFKEASYSFTVPRRSANYFPCES